MRATRENTKTRLRKTESSEIRKHSETCLNQSSLGLCFVFGIDTYSVYAGQINKDFLLIDLFSFLKFSLYGMPDFSEFGFLHRFPCNRNYDWLSHTIFSSID